MSIKEKKNLNLINEDEKTIKSLVDFKLSSKNPDVFGEFNLLLRSENFPDTKYWDGGFNEFPSPQINLLNRTSMTNEYVYDIGGKSPQDIDCKYDIRKIKYDNDDMHVLHIDFKDARIKSGGYYWHCPRLTRDKTYTVSFMIRGKGAWDIGQEQGGNQLINDLDEDKFKLKQWTYTANDSNMNNFIMYCDPSKDKLTDRFIEIAYMFVAEGDQRSLVWKPSPNDLKDSYAYNTDIHPWKNTNNEKLLKVFNRRIARDKNAIGSIDPSYCIRSESINVYPYTDYTFTIQAFNNYALDRAAIWVIKTDKDGKYNPINLFSGTFGNKEEDNHPHVFNFNTGNADKIIIRIDNNGKIKQYESIQEYAELWIHKVKLELGNHFTGFSHSLLNVLNK